MPEQAQIRLPSLGGKYVPPSMRGGLAGIIRAWAWEPGTVFRYYV